MKSGKAPKYKIGLSKDPEGRLGKLQTGNPDKLVLLYTRKLTKDSTEKEARDALKDTDAYEKADGGSEWVIKKYEWTDIIDDLNYEVDKCESKDEYQAKIENLLINKFGWQRVENKLIQPCFEREYIWFSKSYVRWDIKFTKPYVRWDIAKDIIECRRIIENEH